MKFTTRADMIFVVSFTAILVIAYLGGLYHVKNQVRVAQLSSLFMSEAISSPVYPRASIVVQTYDGPLQVSFDVKSARLNFSLWSITGQNNLTGNGILRSGFEVR